ncbi:hypothetical protein ACVWWG_008625 [Bradyrhizobium sp. LB7.2]
MTTITSDAFGRQCLFGRNPHQLPAVELGEQLVRSAHAGRASRREHDGRDIAVAFDLRLDARLRASHDLHQKAADAHAHQLGTRHLDAGEEPHQHPIKTVLDRRTRAAGRPQHRHAAGTGDQQQVAGIDWHAEMLDLAADPGDGCRNHVAAVGDRRRAEHDHEFSAKGEQFLDRG